MPEMNFGYGGTTEPINLPVTNPSNGNGDGLVAPEPEPIDGGNKPVNTTDPQPNVEPPKPAEPTKPANEPGSSPVGNGDNPTEPAESDYEVGTVIEIGDDKYTIDDKGNLVDKDGNIFKEAKDVKEFIAGFEQVDNVDELTMKNILDKVGIEIVDVRIKQINLPPEVSGSIYQRMRAERDAVAKLHRSQGRMEAETIRAQADREVIVKVAEAEKQARELKGEGDAEATRIYAQAYSKNPELFNFLKSMDAYRQSLQSGNDVIVLSPDNDFFNYFNNAKGQ